MAYWDIEYTDTFAGQANYCWVKRAIISVSDRAPRSTVMRRAKAAMGLSGLRGESVNYGDMLEFRPYRMATVLFATWHDCGAHAHCDHGEDQKAAQAAIAKVRQSEADERRERAELARLTEKYARV